jgi:hypothetical protein
LTVTSFLTLKNLQRLLCTDKLQAMVGVFCQLMVTWIVSGEWDMMTWIFHNPPLSTKIRLLWDIQPIDSPHDHSKSKSSIGCIKINYDDLQAMVGVFCQLATWIKLRLGCFVSWWPGLCPENGLLWAEFCTTLSTKIRLLWDMLIRHSLLTSLYSTLLSREQRFCCKQLWNRETLTSTDERWFECKFETCTFWSLLCAL